MKFIRVSDDGLHHALKIECAKSNISMRSATEQAINQWLEKRIEQREKRWGK